MDNLTEFYISELKKHRLSNTKPRRAVFSALSTNGHLPVTMQEIISLTSQHADRSSVYRVVHSLEKAEIIKRIHIGWKYKLELSDKFFKHHHHITCINCGYVHVTHDDDKLEREIKALATKCGFTMTNHQIDIKGLCKTCANR